MYILLICAKWFRYGHKGLSHKKCFLHIMKRKRDWTISNGDFENDGMHFFSFNFEEKYQKSFLVHVN